MIISQFMSVTFTLHPALHSLTMLIKDLFARPGRMWAMRARWGRCGRSILQVWLDATVCPLGRCTVMGDVVGFLLTQGASASRKWLDAPESNMAH